MVFINVFSSRFHDRGIIYADGLNIEGVNKQALRSLLKINFYNVFICFCQYLTKAKRVTILNRYNDVKKR